MNCFQCIVLVLPQFDSQKDFGVVSGSLEILRDGSLAT